MKYAIESIFNRVEKMEDRIRKSELEDRNFEINQLQQNEEKEKSKENLHDLWEYTKRTNIRSINSPELQE